MIKGFRIIITAMAAAAIMTAVTGCAGSYRGITSSITGCVEDEIRISNAWYGYNRMWTASCGDRTYACVCRKAICECVPTPPRTPVRDIR